MKQFAFTLMLFVIVLSPLAAVCQAGGSATGTAVAPTAPTPVTQSLPQPAPTPATHPSAPRISDAGWVRVQRLPYGTYIRVTSTYGPPLECNFAGATDAALFCSEPGSPDGTGYQFERDRVLGVQAVRPRVEAGPEQHRHVGRWIAAAVVGTTVGVMVPSVAGTKTRVGVGIAGALVTIAIAEDMDHGNWPPYPVVQ